MTKLVKCGKQKQIGNTVCTQHNGKAEHKYKRKFNFNPATEK